eukprot:9349082-Heterocapsa_arctica.AAC.1
MLQRRILAEDFGGGFVILRQSCFPLRENIQTNPPPKSVAKSVAKINKYVATSVAKSVAQRRRLVWSPSRGAREGRGVG